MKKTTNIVAIQDIAINFLYIEPQVIDSLKNFGDLFITHPFFNTSCLYSDKEKRMFHIFNEPDLFIEYKKQFEKEIRNKNTVTSILFFITTPYKLTFFKYIKDYLSEKDFAETLMSCYIEMEIIADETNVKKSELINWFEMANKKYLMTKKELNYLNDLPDTITIYRGIRDMQYKYELSWTLDKNKARWFATRFDSDNSILLEVEINKNDILCYTEQRDESEIVINPQVLKSKKIIEYFI